MPHPCMGSRVSVLSTSRSSVPRSTSDEGDGGGEAGDMGPRLVFCWLPTEECEGSCRKSREGNAWGEAERVRSTARREAEGVRGAGRRRRSKPSPLLFLLRSYLFPALISSPL